MSQALHDPPVGPCRPAPERHWTYETFPDLLNRLYCEGFTGKMILDFKDGIAKVATTTRRRVRIKP